MAIKPVIKPITPFDANLGTTIKATYSGNMPYYNRVIVQDAVTLTVVYDRTIGTSDYSHFLDPSYTGTAVATGDVGYALINGRRYTATIQFFGRTLSDPYMVSDKASFLTRTTPHFFFDGVTDGMVIDTASIGLDLVYAQAETEMLVSYQFMIYDNNQKLLQATDIKYDLTDMTYTFKGLDNLTSYYVRALGMTKNGISLDTGFWEIRTQYQNPAVYARMFVSNDATTSENEYWTNFILIEADEDSGYYYEDGWIYLDKGQNVRYSKGFRIEDNATWFLRVKDVDYPRTLMEVKDVNGDGFYLEGIRDINNTLRFRLVVPGSVSNYMLYSQRVNIDWPDIVNIWIRRINNVYQLVVYVEKVSVDVENLYLEQAEPSTTGMAMNKQDLWIDSDMNVEVSNNNVLVTYQKLEPTNPVPYEIWIEDN